MDSVDAWSRLRVCGLMASVGRCRHFELLDMAESSGFLKIPAFSRSLARKGSHISGERADPSRIDFGRKNVDLTRQTGV